MDNQKNNTGLIVLVIVLFLLVLGLGGYIVYDKVLNSKEAPENETTNDVVEEEKLPEWVEYLLNQDISSIVVNKNNPDDPINACPEPVEITKDQLKQILKEMTGGTLIKFIDYAGGFAGPCGDKITIKYGSDKELIFQIDSWIITKDENLLALVEKEKYTAKTQHSEVDIEDLFKYDWDYTYVYTLLG